MNWVMIPADIWVEIENLLSEKKNAICKQEEDLCGFTDLMQAWNFRYPYDPSVKCAHCLSQSRDWREDEPRRFTLVSASLGGLLVFHCASCGATIRHKYFKDHMAVETSPPPNHD